MRVMVVEDEQTLREQLVERLRKEGYAVDPAGDGEEGLYIGREFPCDLGVVDIGLPKMSGIDLIKTLRQEGQRMPIIILTARGRWQEKVEGLEAGADDYMVKPFHIEELLARVKALIRRSAGVAQSETRYGPIVINTSSQSVSLDGDKLELTAFEYKILEHLALHAGAVISKTELTEHIYDHDSDRDSNVIEVLVGRLRRKLDPNNERKPIETLRGRGYRFTLEQSC